MDKLTGNDLISEIVAFHDNVLPTFTVKWDGSKDGKQVGAKQNLGLVYNNHWTNDEIDKHTLQNRVALNMPYLFSKIQTILGYEKSNRNEITVEGENLEDELNGEVVNQFLKKLMRKNHYDSNKDEIFEDGTILDVGIFRLDTEINRMGKEEVQFYRIPYNQLVWDLNFTDYERQTCSREQYFEWVYLDDLVLDYPEKKDELTKYTNSSIDTQDAGYGKFRDLQDYYSHPKGFATEGDDLKWIVKVIHDYKRVNKTVYELHDIQNRKMTVHEEKKDAKEAKDKAIMELKQQMMLQADQQNPLAGSNNSMAMAGATPEQLGIKEDDFIIKPRIEKRIAYSVVTASIVLKETEILEEEDFRHIVYFCLFKNGEWWTLVDIGRDPAHFMDKMYSQIDYDIGTDVKTAKQLNTTIIDLGHQTIEEAKDALTKGDVIYTNTSEDAIKVIKRSGTNTQYFKIQDELKDLLNNIYGGANYQGNAEGSDQSGVAVEKLQEAGSILTLNYLKNLNRFDLLFGEKLVKFIQSHYDYETMFKVLGSEFTDEVMAALQDNKMYIPSMTDPSKGYLVLNKDGSAPLSDNNLEVSVTTQSSKMNDNDTKLKKLMMFEQVSKIPIAQYAPELYAERLGFSATEKQKLIKAAEQFKADQKAMQEQQQKMAEAGALHSGLLATHAALNNGQTQNINQEQK